MRTPPLHAYRAATGLLEPLAPMILRGRARRGKEDISRLAERMGHAARARPPGPLVWLHGASVGEGLSLLPLVEGFRARRPALNLLVTSGTITSADLLARRLPAGVLHQFAPVDLPGVSRRFLQHWRPELAVFVESEIWPNLIGDAKAQGVRLALVSARLSPSTVRGWSRAPASARALLSDYDLILPQDEAAAGAFRALGGADYGRLNLKRMGEPLPVDAAVLEAHRRGAGERPILLAASTHPGEDERVLDAFAPLAERRPRSHLVIVPRHPDRGAGVAALSRARGFGATRQAAGEPFAGQTVHVADTLGELGLWFRLARACFVGGAWAEGVGGHNPLEPARLGCAAASGPDVENWRGVYNEMAAAGAIRVVEDAGALTGFWRQALDADPAVAAQADRARRFAEQQTGALDAALDRLEALV